jgi:TonB-dependent starch-binding outer membrane protein SusC
VNLTSAATTRFVEDADFIKVDNVSLGYSLPRTLTDKLGIQRLRAYVQGQNLLMITDYKGLDPEMENTGVDINGTPRSRIMSFGVNVTF